MQFLFTFNLKNEKKKNQQQSKTPIPRVSFSQYAEFQLKCFLFILCKLILFLVFNGKFSKTAFFYLFVWCLWCCHYLHCFIFLLIFNSKSKFLLSLFSILINQNMLIYTNRFEILLSQSIKKNQTKLCNLWQNMLNWTKKNQIVSKSKKIAIN